MPEQNPSRTPFYFPGGTVLRPVGSTLLLAAALPAPVSPDRSTRRSISSSLCDPFDCGKQVYVSVAFQTKFSHPLTSPWSPGSLCVSQQSSALPPSLPPTQPPTLPPTLSPTRPPSLPICMKHTPASAEHALPASTRQSTMH